MQKRLGGPKTALEGPKGVEKVLWNGLFPPFSPRLAGISLANLHIIASERAKFAAQKNRRFFAILRKKLGSNLSAELVEGPSPKAATARFGLRNVFSIACR